MTATTGDITSILFGVPGEATTAAIILDGHAMAKRGEAGRALGAALASSLIGATWNGTARRQSNNLLAPAIEKWVIADNEPADTRLIQGIESRVDLAFGAGLQDIDLNPRRARRFLDLLYNLLRARIIRVHEKGDRPDLRN